MALNRHIDFLLYDETSSETDKLEVVGSVIEVEEPEDTTETVENTPYGSNQGDYKGYDYGLSDLGEFSATILYSADNTFADAIEAAKHSRTKIQVAFRVPKLASADTTREQRLMTVLVTKVSRSIAEKGNKLRRTFTFKPDGAPDRTPYTIPV
jgi:hypothetical protein